MLKEMIIVLRNKVFANESVEFSELVKDYKVDEATVAYYHNLVRTWKADAEKGLISNTGQKIWSDAEREIVMSYVLSPYTHKDEDGKTKTRSKKFAELEEILHRTKDSIAYYYYTMAKESEVVKESEKPKEEVVVKEEPVVVVEEDSNEEDIIDSVVSLMNNLGKVEDKSVLNMFKGLSNLVAMATDSKENDKIAELETKLQSALDENKKLVAKSLQLEKKMSKTEAKYNDLRAEVENFHNMSSADKLKNIKIYDEKIKSLFESAK